MQNVSIHLTIFFMAIMCKYLIFVLFITASSSNAYERYNKIKRYDQYFKKYSKRFFEPVFDRLYFKAQAVAESRLQAEAKSGVGAKGIMQIMPKTFKEIKHKNPAIKGRSREAKWNIAAGIYYDRTMWNLWKAKRPLLDKIRFIYPVKAGRQANLRGINIRAERGT